MRTLGLVMVVSLALATGACGGSSGTNPGLDAGIDAPAATDTGAADANHDVGLADGPVAGDGGNVPCPRSPAAADRVRRVVVSLPYNASGLKAETYEVLAMAADGTLSRPGVTFTMGRSMGGEIGFTPDGEVGVAVQDDGTLGVFRLDASGTPTVVHSSFTGGFYAAQVVMDPTGTGAWVLDSEWRSNGGGIYRVDIACDGTLTDKGLVAAGKLPSTMTLLAGGRAAVAAFDLLTTTEGPDLHLVSSLNAPTIVGSADVFPTADGGVDEQVVQSMAATADGKYLLVGDICEFCGSGSRLAGVEIQSGGLRAAQLFAFNDPYAIVASPFGQVLLVVSGYGNALYVVDYDSQSATPFSVRGELAPTGGKPQLPGAAVMVSRGALSGRVLVAELTAIRQVKFSAGGVVADLGPFSFGSGYTAMVGAIGVQP
jgi:hypothetical protein